VAIKYTPSEYTMTPPLCHRTWQCPPTEEGLIILLSTSMVSYNFAVSHGTIAIARGCQRVRVISYDRPMQAQSVSCGGPRIIRWAQRSTGRNFIKVQSSVQFNSGVLELHVLPPHSSCCSI